MAAAVKPIGCWDNVDEETFRTEIYPVRQPAILRGVPVGRCTSLWDRDYLCTRGGTRSVKVHVSQERHMDFLSKNFVYRTLPFCELVQRASCSKQTDYFISETEFYYLRTLGADSRKEPANIVTQFPELAEDVVLPKLFPEEAFFSSVLRIASPQLCLWTHYDVMDNFLIQVRGKKKAVLFHPNDFDHLYIRGDKSLVLDVEHPDLEKFPKFQRATKYEAVLNAGDVLFIPALWFHNMTALDFGIAVNVFWRHLDASLYDGNDPYGNKDPIPAGKALASVTKAVKELRLLPSDYQQFYALKMISQIKEAFHVS
ncbi:tRNA wybutosine-synthesizing protein 5-like [Amblyomma americanum]